MIAKEFRRNFIKNIQRTQVHKRWLFTDRENAINHRFCVTMKFYSNKRLDSSEKKWKYKRRRRKTRRIQTTPSIKEKRADFLGKCLRIGRHQSVFGLSHVSGGAVFLFEWCVNTYFIIFTRKCLVNFSPPCILFAQLPQQQ